MVGAIGNVINSLIDIGCNLLIVYCVIFITSHIAKQVNNK